MCEQKRQVKTKLRQLQRQSEEARGWLYWQQLVLPRVLGYGFHLIDTLLIVLAIVVEFVKFCKTDSCDLDEKIRMAVLTWNAVVVGIYGMIALGEVRISGDCVPLPPPPRHTAVWLTGTRKLADQFVKLFFILVGMCWWKENHCLSCLLPG